LAEIKTEEIFIMGEITKNLENLQTILTKKLESIPREVSEIKEISGLFASEKYDIWAKAIDSLMASINREEEMKEFIKKGIMLKEVEDTLNEWRVVFKQLPSEENLEALLSFTVPKYEKFDFNIFSRPDQVKLIFSKLSEAKSLLESITETCKEFKISLKASDINNLINSYKNLSKAIKSPLEPTGDPVLISRQKDKIVVSIPLDIAFKKMEYLKGIEPTPLIHRPEKLKKEEFQEEISKLQAKINETLKDLRKAKANLSHVKKLLKEVKGLRENLFKEIETIKTSHERIQKELNKLIKSVESAYYHLCETFKLEFEELDFSNEETLERSFDAILKSCNKAQQLFYEDLSKNLEKYPELLQTIKITEKTKKVEPKEVIEKIREELQRKIKEASKLQEEYRKLNEWILTNSSQVKWVEDRIRTIKILTIITFLAQEILTRIYQKTNVERIVEELAEKIEESVKETYNKIFPEDESFIFEHIGEGKFLSTINNKLITHPSGSQRVAISLGIMLSLAETFKLPIILDEAFDRLDINRIKFFCECVTTLSKAFQLCLVGYTSYNIEKNPSVLTFINNWKIYKIERIGTLEKNIKPIQTLAISE
jgi:sugar-specific transcriptional regulator TrmB